MKNKNIVALLPLKLNSERVKGKNFKIFSGKPLFRWMLDELLKINRIDKIVINTDARVKLFESGFEESKKIVIRDRKQDLCGDFVSMNKIIEDDINNFEAGVYLMTHTTNPLLSAETINKSISAYKQGVKLNKNDSLFTVNVYQTRFYRSDGSAINHDPNSLLRTQDLEVWYEENSNLYIFSRESFFKTKSRIGISPILMETPFLESVDIDDYDKWDIAEKLASLRNDRSVL